MFKQSLYNHIFSFPEETFSQVKHWLAGPSKYTLQLLLFQKHKEDWCLTHI